jgi:plastocyanin
MKKKICTGFSLGVLVGIICLALAGCGGGSDGGGGGTGSTDVAVVDCSTVTSAATVTATSQNTFLPQNVPVAVNDVVRWISASNITHTVTSGTMPPSDNKFDQTLSTAGSQVCLKFTVAGTFNYYCTFHYAQGMTGTVTVQ